MILLKIQMNLKCCWCLSIENMLYTLHATYIEHNFYADFSLTDLQFKMNEISHCSDFDSLLLKHELQMFHIQESKLSEEMRFSRSTVIVIVYHASQTLALLKSMWLICFVLSVKIFLMQIDHVLQRCSYATLLIRQRSLIILY